MDRIELETPLLLEGDDLLAGSIVELIVAASDSSEDQWAIADRIDELVESGRTELHPGEREQLRPSSPGDWRAPSTG